MAKSVDIEALISRDPEQSNERVPQVEYLRYSKDPLGRNRVVTDPAFIYISAMKLVFWVAVVSVSLQYEIRRFERRNTRIANANNYSTDLYERHRHSSPIERIDEVTTTSPTHHMLEAIARFYDHGGFSLMILSVFIAQMMMIGFLRLLTWHPKFFTKIGLFGIHFSSSVWILTVVALTMTPELLHKILLYLLLLVLSLIALLKQTSVKMIGVEMIAEIIQKTSQSLLHYGSSLLIFSQLVLILQVFVACVTFVIRNSLSNSCASRIIVLSGGLHILWYIRYFSNMVISQAVATWHSKENKDKVPKSTLFTSVKIISRYHLGSIGLQAICLLPFCMSIQAAICSKARGIVTLSAYLSRKVCKIGLILDSATSSCIEIALNGSDSHMAINKVHNLVSEHSFFFLGVTSISHAICLYASIIISLMHSLVCGLIFAMVAPHGESDIFFIGAVAVIVTSVLNSWLIMNTAVQTTVFCCMESYEEDKLPKSKQLITSTDNCTDASAPTVYKL